MHSATIIGPDATTTDALSTSVFVLGVEQGLALVNRLPDIDAILVDAKGQLHYSNGLLPAKNPTNNVKPSTPDP
jgi:thiamine biosynthesis lipoprotein